MVLRRRVARPRPDWAGRTILAAADRDHDHLGIWLGLEDYHQRREVLSSAGSIEVTVPRVNDKRTDRATGERVRFCSVILPPWCRKTP